MKLYKIRYGTGGSSTNCGHVYVYAESKSLARAALRKEITAGGYGGYRVSFAQDMQQQFIDATGKSK